VTIVRADSGSLFSYSIAKSPSPAIFRVLAVALVAALTAAAAQISAPLPFTAVPLTLTPMIVLLGGAALGSRLGAAAQVTYLLAGIAGLPVFSASATLPPGAARLLGPTGGYLLAYPIAAFVTGWLAERGWDRRYWTSVVAMMVGLALIFVGGVSWLSIGFTHSFTIAAAQGFVPFIAIDLVKVSLAALILPQTWRLVGRR
jgi:biotin transport system substrate-specific component